MAHRRLPLLAFGAALAAAVASCVGGERDLNPQPLPPADPDRGESTTDNGAKGSSGGGGVESDSDAGDADGGSDADLSDASGDAGTEGGS
jgi:hypothetical protein